MKKNIFLPVVCILLYVQSAPTISEMVWLKDVTRSFKTEKMKHDDLDLPDELTFHLTGRSSALTLNLKRNPEISPNAFVYFVRNLKDGQPHLDKVLSLEQENLAYYQDRDNGAFMTVRCVKRSNRQCNRVINGYIRIGDKYYDLLLADVSSRNVRGFLGTQYVLREQANIQTYVSTKRKSDKRNRDIYWIEIAVLIDTSVWDLFVSLAVAHKWQQNLVYETDVEAARRIREYFSHIINGIHQRYNNIEDPSIEIGVTLRELIIFQKANDIALTGSLIKSYDGKTYVDVDLYLDSIALWDAKFGLNATHDHAMLFTRHVLSDNSLNETAETAGRADESGICDPGRRISVVRVTDYFETVHTATHELGHNLGSKHDGEDTSIDCPAKDLFIMTPSLPLFNPNEPYSRNPWVFSNCSVRTFKQTLKLRECLKNQGTYFDKVEWKMFTAKLPGEVYSYNEQCEFINGPNSVFCGDVDDDLCLFFECTDPKTRQCCKTPFSASRGTKCGTDKEKVAVCPTQQSKPKHLANF